MSSHIGEGVALAEARQLSFSVDTHLLRELGALLVGRDSTALLELIKNSYDADATAVTVHAEGLGSPGGRIVVSDNGLGMTFERFGHAFLRIAGRSKETGTRRSTLSGRRYTGAKGIGRLAAHKLSSRLEVTSIPAPEVLGKNSDDRVGVQATLNWDAIEGSDNDLTSLDQDELSASPLDLADYDRTGTTMALEGVRGAWPARRLSDFLSEMRSCRPSEVLLSPLPTGTVTKPVLFSRPLARDTSEDDPGFDVDLTGDLAGSEDMWQTMTERADWVLEIQADARAVRYGVAPTRRKQEELVSLLGKRVDDWLGIRKYERPHPDPKRGPFFEGRVLVTEGSVSRQKRFADLRRFEQQDSGIRVYLEGFRVLPYGSRGDDWLRLDADHVRRVREYDTPDELGFDKIEQEGFVQLGNRAYYGAVFLTEQGVSHLQALINREGFVPDEYFHTLRDMVRTGPDLVSRTRASIRNVLAQLKAEQREVEEERKRREAEAAAEEERERHERASEGEARVKAGDADTDESDDSDAGDDESVFDPTGANDVEDTDPEFDDHVVDVPESELERLLWLAGDAAAAMRAAPSQSLYDNRYVALTSTLRSIGLRLENAQAQQTNLRVLASIGAQYSGFIHEINGLLAQSQTLRRLLESLSNDLSAVGGLSRQHRADLRAIIATANELVQSLTRQSSYLTDVVGPDARRRRSRMLVRARIDSALRLLTPRVLDRNQTVEVDIDPNLKSPPVFAAEIAILVTNLVSNAVKFGGNGGRVRITGFLDNEARLHLVFENTGVHVAKRDRERFFLPFESSTTDVDVLLGQGMGLGLPIVRNLAEDYGGTAAFVNPSAGFATAVEVVIPDPRPDLSRRR